MLYEPEIGDLVELARVPTPAVYLSCSYYCTVNGETHKMHHVLLDCVKIQAYWVGLLQRRPKHKRSEENE